MKRDKKKKAYEKMKNIMRNNLPKVATHGRSLSLKSAMKVYHRLLDQGKTKGV